MTAANRRGAYREQETADKLGGERIKYRPRYQRSPDVVPIRFADGTVVVPESATRKKLPSLIVTKMRQAAGYVEGAVPLVVLSETGGRAIACMPLEDFARLVGLRSPPDGEQLVLLGGLRK
jgi:hypothetical protein